jgi:hypothetical protein
MRRDDAYPALDAAIRSLEREAEVARLIAEIRDALDEAFIDQLPWPLGRAGAGGDPRGSGAGWRPQ